MELVIIMLMTIETIEKARLVAATMWCSLTLMNCMINLLMASVKNPMAIRGFCNYTLQNWSTPPQHLLLIGKALRNKHTRNNTSNYANNLVPTFGNPPSDNLLTAGLAGTTWEPAIATGRIAARFLGGSKKVFR